MSNDLPYDESYKFNLYAAIRIDTGAVMYVGSTVKDKPELEDNHRNAKSKGFTITDFRWYLAAMGDKITFTFIESLVCTRALAELIEQEHINTYRPTLNDDLVPFNTSRSDKYHRIDDDLAATTITTYRNMERNFGITDFDH